MCSKSEYPSSEINISPSVSAKRPPPIPIPVPVKASPLSARLRRLCDSVTTCRVEFCAAIHLINKYLLSYCLHHDTPTTMGISSTCPLSLFHCISSRFLKNVSSKHMKAASAAPPARSVLTM